MAARYANIRAPLPSAPKMNTGLRPMRSASVAHAGMATSATALVTMATHSIVVLSSPTVSTANDSAHTAKIVLTVDASAPKVTRSTLARWSRSSTATGTRSTPSCGRLAEGRGVVQPAPDEQARDDDEGAQPERDAPAPASAARSSGRAPIGSQAAVAMTSPACVPPRVKLV